MHPARHAPRLLQLLRYLSIIHVSFILLEKIFTTKDTKYTKEFFSLSAFHRILRDLRVFAVNLCRGSCGDLCDFAIDRNGGVRADQSTNSTPRASVFERVRGVVALWCKPRH